MSSVPTYCKVQLDLQNAAVFDLGKAWNRTCNPLLVSDLR